MKRTQWFCSLALFAITTTVAPAQDFPKPGPEHAFLKKMEGTWDVTMKVAGGESKGTVSYKMELGGLWLTSSLECDIFGSKFTGKGLDTYDLRKKKFVSIWFDSMNTQPTIMEGTHDPVKKTLTMTGEGPGMDGKPTKFRSVSEMPDDNTVHFSMYMGDSKEPGFVITYKRKK